MEHELIGREITYEQGGQSLVGRVVGAKPGPFYADGKSKVGAAKIRATVRLQIEPLAGGQRFWSAPMLSETPNAGAEPSRDY